MKNLESFFSTSNYDTKNITNKGNKEISQQVLTDIEEKGVTLEMLEGLGVPVFKYRTQITIHGYFPELCKQYLGGYKMLFQNKNLSIGMKWQAVDYSKKLKIYDYVRRFCGGWQLQRNSSEFFIYKTSKIFNDKETYKQFLETAKQEIAHVDNKLFFGNSEIYLSRTLWGGYYLVTYINIGAILETNLLPCIENICQATITDIEAKFEVQRIKREQEEEQRKQDREKEIQERKEKQAPLLEAAREMLTNAGFVLQEKQPIYDGFIGIKIGTDIETGRFNFVAYKYTKGAKQKKFRFEKETSDTLQFNFRENCSDLYRQETRNTEFTGYVKPVEKVAPAQLPEAKKEGIKTVQYSDKCIAVYGETKSIKEELKSIGAKFNGFLTIEGVKQAGWILPLTQSNKLAQIGL